MLAQRHTQEDTVMDIITTVIEDTGDRVDHPMEGLVFDMYQAGPKHYVYYDVMESPENRDLLIQSIQGGESTLFDMALVRHGKPKQWSYYPLPLIFASPEERQMAAKLAGKRPPPERWARRKRQHILEMLAIEDPRPFLERWEQPA